MENVSAVIELGAKQYIVKPGDKIMVEKLNFKEGEEFKIDKILLFNNGEKVNIGKPFLDNVEIIATLIKQTKGKKIIGLKYKAKTGYRRRYGHRQKYSNIEIKKIQQI